MFMLEIGKDQLSKQFTINMCFFQLQSAITKFHLLTVFLAGVNIENELWLADVRFGGTNVTILQMKGLEDNQVHQNRTGRIRRIGDQFIFEQMVKTIVTEDSTSQAIIDGFGTEIRPRAEFTSVYSPE